MSHQKPSQQSRTPAYNSIIAHITQKVKSSTSLFLILTSICGIFSNPAPVFASAYPDNSDHIVATTSYEYNQFYFDDFTADYFLYKDPETGRAKMLVMETLTAIFPKTNQNHGITRVIPFTNNDGKNLTLDTGDTIYIDVKRNGETEPVHQVLVGDGYYEVYIGDPDEYVHGEQVYELTYESQDVVLDFDEWQELYWDVNGNDWQQRFNNVTANVYLDENVADHFTGETSCYVGKYGITGGQNRCRTNTFTEDITIGDQLRSTKGITFTAQKLSAKETLTFDLQFDANTFAPAPTRYSYVFVVIITGVAICACGMIFLMILCWKSVAAKRKYYKNLFVKPEYTPAKDYSVAEMAQNYIGKGGNGDKRVATLLELAVNHKIELIKIDSGKKHKKNQWKIRLKADTLSKQQAIVLKILAGSNTPLRIDQEITIKNHSATSELTSLVQKFNTVIEDNLEKKGLAPSDKKSTSTKKPVNYTNILSIGMIIWFITAIFLFIYMFDEDGVIPSYITAVGDGILQPIVAILLISIFVLSIITIIKTGSFATHTEKGLEYSRYMEGLKLYMSMAEAERLQLLQSVKGADTTHAGVVKLYEKLLPYAVIFKMEKSWLDELSKYYEFDDVAAPVWYNGVGIFVASDFIHAMNSINSTVSSSITHSTTSNSSSGFSGGGGGGFAGGGGGGGGGGGW